MNTKHIIAAVSVATALAVITPAYAGGLGGGLGGSLGGGLGGGMGGMNRMGGLSGQGALQGQGAVGGSLDKPKLHPAAPSILAVLHPRRPPPPVERRATRAGNQQRANLDGTAEPRAAPLGRWKGRSLQYPNARPGRNVRSHTAG